MVQKRRRERATLLPPAFIDAFEDTAKASSIDSEEMIRVLSEAATYEELGKSISEFAWGIKDAGGLFYGREIAC